MHHRPSPALAIAISPRTTEVFKACVVAAVVIGGALLSGGYGYVLGSLLGVLTIGVIYACKEFDGDLNTGWTRVMVGALLCFFIVLQRAIVARRR